MARRLMGLVCPRRVFCRVNSTVSVFSVVIWYMFSSKTPEF